MADTDKNRQTWLGSRPSIEGVQPNLFEKGPNTKDVIEIYGGEGTGKTELLYHVLVSCLMPNEYEGREIGGRNAGVIFIDTEHKFSIIRTATLMEKYLVNKLVESDLIPDSKAMESFIKQCLRKLYVLKCSNSVQLVVTLNTLEELVCSDPDISVIMMDSISSFYWIDKFNGGTSVPSQEKNMKLITSKLGELVNTYSLVVFVTKCEMYKTKGQENATDKSKDYKDVDLDDEHNEYLCKAWRRMVSHRLICVQCPNLEKGSNQFIVGGDVAHGNKLFSVTDAGIEFKI